MKLFGLVMVLVLGAAVAVQAVNVFSLRREVKALAGKVSSLEADAQSAEDRRPPPAPAWGRMAGFPRAGTPPGADGEPQAPPPAPKTAAAPAASSLPLPAALDAPEAREQLRNFVSAEMTRQRDEQREQWAARRDGEERAFRDRVVKELNLNTEEAARLGELMGGQQNARREIQAAVRSGEKTPTDAQAELAALRDKTQSGLREVLGDDRLQKYQDLQRQQRQGGGGPGGPFGFVPAPATRGQ